MPADPSFGWIGVMVAIWILALAVAVWAYDRRVTRGREEVRAYARSVQELEHDTRLFTDDGVIIDIPQYLRVLNHSSMCPTCADLRGQVELLARRVGAPPPHTRRALKALPMAATGAAPFRLTARAVLEAAGFMASEADGEGRPRPGQDRCPSSQSLASEGTTHCRPHTLHAQGFPLATGVLGPAPGAEPAVADRVEHLPTPEAVHQCTPT